MGRNTGLVAALAVALTISGVSNLPRKSIEDTTASQLRKQSATSAEARTAPNYCRELSSESVSLARNW